MGRGRKIGMGLAAIGTAGAMAYGVRRFRGRRTNQQSEGSTKNHRGRKQESTYSEAH